MGRWRGQKGHSVTAPLAPFRPPNWYPFSPPPTDAYYFNAGNLTSDLDQLARIISVHTQSERSALAHAVASFFSESDGGLRQSRADREIARIRDKSIKAKASAKSKHLKDKNNHASVRRANGHANGSANGGANGLLINNQEPLVKEIEMGARHFDEFWTVYPRRIAKPTALTAYTKARKGGTEHEAIITGARRYADECRGKEQRFIAHPATWLNAGRWDDAPGANRDSVNGAKSSGHAGKDRQQPQSRAHILAEFISEVTGRSA
jgi:uncharacterized protein YdaU (DUF1376 family)